MKKLEYAMDKLHISFDRNIIENYRAYMEGILKWNKVINLTSIVEPEEFIVKHYIDSLLCVPFEEFQAAKTVVDVGTGGGFPGIPLALAAPEKQFVLIDSLNKRIKIIKELCDQIGISNVTLIHGRAEELARKKEHREKYDICVSRAVANLATLSEYCLPFIKKNGWFLAYKGPDVVNEVKEAERAIKILGGNLVRKEKTFLEEFDMNHNILFIKKTGITPAKYPRKAGTPSKEPLK